MRLIDADELIRKLKRLRYNDNSYIRTKLITETLHNLVPEVIAEQPTIEAEPVKRGQWIYGEDESGQDGIFCSECEHFVPWCYDYYDKSDDLINDNSRCPNCGARM